MYDPSGQWCRLRINASINDLVVVPVPVVVDTEFVAVPKMIDWLLLEKWLLQKTSVATGRSRPRSRARASIENSQARTSVKL